MSDDRRSCHCCGGPVESRYPFEWQGSPVWMCFDCWDRHFATD